MSDSKKHDPKRTANPKAVAALDALLTSGEIGSAHYVGYAHEPILRVLHRRFGTNFSLMDYWNRYGIETEFDYDSGERLHENWRPDWLEGVPFYSEGGPESDLLIWDMPWHYSDHLTKILNFKPKRPPSQLFLLDEACSEASHPAYTWTATPDYAHGIIKSQSAQK